MIKRTFALLIAVMLLSLAGCAGVTKSPSTTIDSTDAILQGEQSELPGEEVVIEPEPKPVMSGNPAVIALLDRARIDTEAGQRGAAGASLERGLRIEPRNAWLWHELAQLRLDQGQYAQAVSLARKSNSFSGSERRLQAANWRLIGNARVAQGNPAGAEQAYEHATMLEQVEQSEQSLPF